MFNWEENQVAYRGKHKKLYELVQYRYDLQTKE